MGQYVEYLPYQRANNNKQLEMSGRRLRATLQRPAVEIAYDLTSVRVRFAEEMNYMSQHATALHG